MDAMGDHFGNHANELEAAIAARRLNEHIERLALSVFSAEELAAVPAENRKVLDMLFKRRMRDAGADLTQADCLGVRQQFEQYTTTRVSDPLALRLATQLR
jgi:hypothetical protein